MSHRERFEELRARVSEQVDRAYRDPSSPWQVRDECVPLLVDLVAELGGVVLELELLRAGAGLASSVDVEVERDAG